MIGLIFDEGLVAVLISGAFLCNSVDEIDREGDMRQQIGVRDQERRSVITEPWVEW